MTGIIYLTVSLDRSDMLAPSRVGRPVQLWIGGGGGVGLQRGSADVE